MADNIPNDQSQETSGMKVDVTPSTSPIGTPQPASSVPGQRSNILSDHKVNLKYIGIAAIALIIIIGIVAIGLPGMHSTTTTQQTTTTISQSGSYLSSCQNVASPGKYTMQSTIRTSTTDGACINVTADNVAINCSGQSILGSGPYTGVPPFSYGIYAYNRSNVTVTDCGIGNFSFGVYMDRVKGFSITQTNMSHNYMSSLYLGNSSSGRVSDNYISNSTSPNGAVYINNGTTNVVIDNNTLKLNSVYGFRIGGSTGLSFFSNHVSLSQSSFYCSGQAGFPSSSRASGNICTNDTGCGFLECNGTNKATNLTQVVLRYGVSSCGSIENPGTYNLGGNINVFDYIDPKLKSNDGACIRVNTSNVKLDCNGYSINNAGIAISASGVGNLTVSNCTITNSSTGVRLQSVKTAKIMKSNMLSDGTGLAVYNVSGMVVTNLTASNGTVGIQLTNSSSNIFQRVSALRNSNYGIYISNSLGNDFNFGTASGNREFDVYTDNSSSAAGDGLMSNYNCGVSDALWATCTSYVLANHTSTPVNGCTDLLYPGSYIMQSNVISAPSDCIQVSSNNVTLNCNNQIVSSSSSVSGPAILVDGRRNVTLENCRVEGYGTGILVQNSKGITLNYSHDNATGNYGIVLSNVSNAVVAHNFASAQNGASIYLYNVTKSTIIHNNMTLSEGSGATAMLVDNSMSNLIADNYGAVNNNGFTLAGLSHNNTIINNWFTSDKGTDYVCNGYNSALSAENGGKNSGSSKSGCKWLAVIPQNANPLACQSAYNPTIQSLSQDFIYAYNSTCFLISGSGSSSTINCNGHTILAPNGGSLVWIDGTHSVTLENCYLKGFTKPVVVTNSYGDLITNTTMLDNNTALTTNTSTAAVGIYSTSSATVSKLNITTKFDGIYASNSVSLRISNNTVNATGTAYGLYSVNSSVINGDASVSGSGTGITVSNSVNNQFSEDNFSAIANGMLCLFSSQKNSSNSDIGGNSCSSNNGCSWIEGSSASCP